ncbi:MAG: hypothetical protein WCD42_10240 [Rhizomicrobium sp.]
MIRRYSLALTALLVMGAAQAQPLPEPPPGQPFCAYPAPGKVIFHGTTEALAACLDGAHEQTIAELRITSPGGDAATTLKLADRYAGRIGHLIVDQRCTGTCATYIVPTAARLTVLPQSFLIVHGAFDAERLIDKMKALQTAYERQHPGKAVALSPSEPEVWAIDKEQDDFSRRWLSCPEWLHPDSLTNSATLAKRLPQTPAEKIRAYIVSRSMATRCLKQTRLADYWSAAGAGDIPAPLQLQGIVQIP